MRQDDAGLQVLRPARLLKMQGGRQAGESSSPAKSIIAQGRTKSNKNFLKASSGGRSRVPCYKVKISKNSNRGRRLHRRFSGRHVPINPGKSESHEALARPAPPFRARRVWVTARRPRGRMLRDSFFRGTFSLTLPLIRSSSPCPALAVS
jgi:hypothetical protein